jgi:hypothetical protein
MNSYCGHISVENGKISIDLGGGMLPDGVYSIMQESIPKQNKKKDQSPMPLYDIDKFVKDVKAAMKGREGIITMNTLAREMKIYETTLVRRIKENNLLHLFKLRKPASEYMDY